MRKVLFIGLVGIFGAAVHAASTLSISPAPNAYGWNNTPVTVTITGDPPITWRVSGGPSQSGPSPISFALASEGVHVVEYRDATEPGFKSAVIRLDFTPPRIQVRVPEPGSSYILNQPILADWSAWDELSGLAEAHAPASPGQPVDTRSPGQQRFRVWAKDRAGNEAELNVVYYVRGILQAVLPSGFYLDRVLPKEEMVLVGRFVLRARYTVGEPVVFAFAMKDYFGQIYARAWPEISVVGVRFVDDGEEYPLRAWFRVPFDAEKGGYYLVIPTKEYAPGYYDLWVLFGDGQFERIRIELAP